MPFVKGQSGNPGGRTGSIKTTALLQVEALKYGQMAIEALVRHMTRDDAGDARLAAVSERAAEALLDRCGLTVARAEFLATKAAEQVLPARTMTIEDLERAATQGEQ